MKQQEKVDHVRSGRLCAFLFSAGLGKCEGLIVAYVDLSEADSKYLRNLRPGVDAESRSKLLADIDSDEKLADNSLCAFLEVFVETNPQILEEVKKMNRRQQLKEILKTMDFYQEDKKEWENKYSHIKHKLAKALERISELESKLA